MLQDLGFSKLNYAPSITKLLHSSKVKSWETHKLQACFSENRSKGKKKIVKIVQILYTII